MNRLSAEVVVIGGGAAGMLCSAVAAERGLDVILLEPNRILGRKLRITGKGRCNVTNNCDIKEFLLNIPGDGRFLYSALNRLSPRDTMELFEGLGLRLKTERGNRVFPVSDNANDVAGTLQRYMNRAGVRVVHSSAKHILTEDSAVTGVETSDGVIECRAAVICTGGLSYPLTGSTGAGYAMARELGHTVTPTRPSLVPLESDDDYCAEMQGFSLKNVTLSAYEDGKLIYKELGEMLFTHFGVSGPLVLSASSHMRRLGEARYELVRLSGIPAETKVNSITREQRHELLKLLKSFPVSITGPRPIDEAIVTSGGVSTKEINPRTMQSKLVGGLYFAGEVMDLDAYTGGFNLQIAWSTAYVAANSI